MIDLRAAAGAGAPAFEVLAAARAPAVEVLAAAKTFKTDLITKTSLMLGLGETRAEILEAMTDIRAAGVDVVTFGQYLRPTSHHLPIVRYADPAEFVAWKQLGESYGIGHVEASPLTRSSYHAKGAAESVSTPVSVSAVSGTSFS